MAVTNEEAKLETAAPNTAPETKPETDAPDKAPETKPETDKGRKSRKKNKKGSRDGENSADNSNQPLEKHTPDAMDRLTFRRDAKEVRRSVVLRRVLAVLLVILIAIIALVYAVSYFYDKFGSFTVKIDKYDMVRQGLSLSETPEFDRTTSRLTADIVYDMTNISGEDLPENIDKINGCHNGDSYIAYTFYLSNAGEDTITYEGEMTMENVTGGVDEAIRVALFRNGEKTVYGKTKSNGGGIEGDCDSEFASSTVVAYEKHEDFHPGETDKYTVVIWLEGNDPDCTDQIIGGTMKLGMNFRIIENT